MVLLLNRYTNLANVALSTIVDPTIIKDELHVLHEFLDALILVLLQFGLDRGKVHRVLHHQGVVRDVQLDIVDGVGENVRLLIPLQCREHSLRGLLPLVEYGGALGHFGNGELVDGLIFSTILVELKVLGDLWVLPLKLIKLRVAHGRVEAALPQLGQHVAAGDFALVLDGLGLRGRRLRLRPPVGAIPTTSARV